MDESRLTVDEKKALLGLARSAIAQKLKLDHPRPAIPPTPVMSSESGAFVTLHKGGRLRGCIGNFSGSGALTRTVEDMAEAAAFEDPRFPPLRAGEFPEIDLEISVLTPMRRITDVNEIEVGRHGLYMTQGPFRGVLLPQVPVEQGWNRDAFLRNTCLKAGLGQNCWQDPQTQIYVFSAEVFGEKDLGIA